MSEQTEDAKFLDLKGEEKNATYRHVMEVTIAKAIRVFVKPFKREALPLSKVHQMAVVASDVLLQYEETMNLLEHDNNTVMSDMVHDYFLMMMSNQGWHGDHVTDILKNAVLEKKTQGITMSLDDGLSQASNDKTNRRSIIHRK